MVAIKMICPFLFICFNSFVETGCFLPTS
jgi:hypothetical protein